MTRVDLFLGGDIGLWALRNADADAVHQVVTPDGRIAIAARERGLPAWTGNWVDFVPSTTGLSVHFPQILRQSLISKYQKIYNLHPGYLPWGRGYYPIFWALWEQSPAGATLHELTARVDAGPIVAQTSILHYEDDTGGSLFRRVREAERALFRKYWPQIVEGAELPSLPQQEGGSYHSRREFLALKEHADWRSMNGNDLVRLIRCLTFPGYPGLNLSLGEEQFEVRLARGEP